MFEAEQTGSPALLLSPAVTRRRPRLTAMDAFFAANMVVVAVMAATVYFPRWLALHGPGAASVATFLSHAALFFLTGVLLWAWLRRHPLPLRFLAMAEVGVLAHFAGTLIHFGGHRLYGQKFFGIPYDKYLHAACTLFAALVVQEICRLRRGSGAGRWTAAIAAFVLGLVWEGSSVVVMPAIPGNLAASLADSLRDLGANACGALVFLSVAQKKTRPSSPR